MHCRMLGRGTGLHVGDRVPAVGEVARWNNVHGYLNTMKERVTCAWLDNLHLNE